MRLHENACSLFHADFWLLHPVFPINYIVDRAAQSYV
jgi:hypothetical protein